MEIFDLSLASPSASDTHSITRPDLPCASAMIADGAIPDLSVKFFFIMKGDSFRHNCSFPIRRKSLLSSLGGSCRAASVCVAALRFTRLNGGYGSLAAFRAAMAHGNALTCGFYGSTRGSLSVIFVTLGADVAL